MLLKIIIVLLFHVGNRIKLLQLAQGYKTIKLEEEFMTVVDDLILTWNLCSSEIFSRFFPNSLPKIRSHPSNSSSLSTCHHRSMTLFKAFRWSIFISIRTYILHIRAIFTGVCFLILIAAQSSSANANVVLNGHRWPSARFNSFWWTI